MKQKSVKYYTQTIWKKFFECFMKNFWKLSKFTYIVSHCNNKNQISANKLNEWISYVGNYSWTLKRCTPFSLKIKIIMLQVVLFFLYIIKQNIILNCWVCTLKRKQLKSLQFTEIYKYPNNINVQEIFLERKQNWDIHKTFSYYKTLIMLGISNI